MMPRLASPLIALGAGLAELILPSTAAAHHPASGSEGSWVWLLVALALGAIWIVAASWTDSKARRSRPHRARGSDDDAEDSSER